MIVKLKLLFLCFFLIVGPAIAGDDYRVTHSVVGKYDDIRENVVNAITNQGLVINNISHIGDMLLRTGRDVGDRDPIFINAEIFEFCSAVTSRESMKADPHAIVFCPYGIAAYVLPSDPQRVYLTYRKPMANGSPQAKKALKLLEKLMNDIVQEALP
ncbi:MAG: DUF302 domain-containing protein [Sulfuricella sp.]|nr:DUF302 domain-containing protein [Sulfuricella sp.]